MARSPAAWLPPPQRVSLPLPCPGRGCPRGWPYFPPLQLPVPLLWRTEVPQPPAGGSQGHCQAPLLTRSTAPSPSGRTSGAATSQVAVSAAQLWPRSMSSRFAPPHTADSSSPPPSPACGSRSPERSSSRGAHRLRGWPASLPSILWQPPVSSISLTGWITTPPQNTFLQHLQEASARSPLPSPAASSLSSADGSSEPPLLQGPRDQSCDFLPLFYKHSLSK